MNPTSLGNRLCAKKILEDFHCSLGARGSMLSSRIFKQHKIDLSSGAGTIKNNIFGTDRESGGGFTDPIRNRQNLLDRIGVKLEDVRPYGLWPLS